jgi:hypothetical protein
MTPRLRAKPGQSGYVVAQLFLAVASRRHRIARRLALGNL